MNKRVLYIGGSPCSGKSTLAEMIALYHGAHYFKADDYLGRFVEKAAAEGKPTCSRYQRLTPDEIWMQDPLRHCRDEFQIYEEIAPYFFQQLQQIDAALIVTEGAAYTPEVMEKHGFEHYIAIIPTPEFQIEHYRQREWIRHILSACSDQDRAFDNWMKRDILFAEQVQKECTAMSVKCFVNDGSQTIEQLYAQAIEALEAFTS